MGIVGAGRMGTIRALSAKSHPHCHVVHVVDSLVDRASALASQLGCGAGPAWEELLERNDVDVVVVAVPHKFLAPISSAALKLGKHVFCEKPGARSAAEAQTVLRAASDGWPSGHPSARQSSRNRNHPRFVIGFTLRHHPALLRAHEMVETGVIGEPLYVCGRYGHGGRPGYEQEWRADPDLAGGGELLDQGVHLIDLSRWFLGEFEQVLAHVATFSWRTKQVNQGTRLEDNAFLLLRCASGRAAWLHASWTQWKNRFSFEIYGEDGSIEAKGLCGSYGPERLVVARRRREGGPPEMQETDLSAEIQQNESTNPWTHEWDAFVSSVLAGAEAGGGTHKVCSASGVDAWEALRTVEAAYLASLTGTAVSIPRSAAPVSSGCPTTR